MTQQFWKLPFKKTGYPAETQEFSTVGKSLGDTIVLSRKYFQISGTTAIYLDKKDNQYKSASLGTENTNFLVTKGLDEELTDSISIPIYTRIQLKSSKILNTILKITYQPFGDILDPKDFQQELSPTSDVNHKSLTLTNNLTCNNTITSKEIISENATIASLLKVKSLIAEAIKVDEVQIGNGKNKLNYSEGFFKINGKTFPHIDPANLIPGKTAKLLTLSPANFIELVPVDWLKLNVTENDLMIQDTNILEAINNLKQEIIGLKEQIRILKEGA